MRKSSIKTSFILGAGLGTRLRPLTNNCPKPLLPVGGRAIITYVMDHLINAGIERIIINTHYFAAAYLKSFPNLQWRGIPIILRYEPELLDTAGGIKNIEDLLEGDEAVLVYNGDTFTDLPLNRLIEGHHAKGKEVTLALRSSGPLLNVNLNAKGEICDLRQTLGDHGVRSCLFAGIYIVEKTFIRRLTAGRKESIVPVLVAMIRKEPGSVAGIIIDEGDWYDIGSVDEYEKINLLLDGHK